MTAFIIRYKFICMFLCAPFFSFAQIDSLFDLAGQYAHAGNYSRAILEYERIVYLSGQQPQEIRARLAQARILKQTNQPEQALDILISTPLMGIDDSLRAVFLYETALCAFLSNDFNTAEAQFKRMEFRVEDTALYTPYQWLYVLTLTQNGHFEKAREALHKSIKNIPSLSADEQQALSKQIDSLFHEDNLPNLKDPEKAMMLSTFIPGAGQMYAGYPGEGLLNLSLHLVSLSVAAYAGYHGFYITGYVAGLAVFQKFYFGSKERAYHLAEKNNKSQFQEFNSHLSRLMSCQR